MEEVRKYKPLFLISIITMTVLLLWHFTDVLEAVRVSGDSFLKRDYLMLLLGGMMLCLMVGLLLLSGKLRLIQCWFIAFGFLGIISLRVLPGLSAPDEPVHYITSYRLSNMLMGIEPEDEKGHVYIRCQDYALEAPEILGRTSAESTYREVRDWSELHPADETFEISPGAPKGMTASSQQWVKTTLAVHLPQALGITVARLLGLDSAALIVLGKIFNLAVFMILVYLAIVIMPFGKEIMAASTLLPMTVSLAASMSYDTLLIALTYLFIAKVLRLAYGDGSPCWKDIAVLAGILAIISPCKLVYGVIIFLLLMIPRKKFQSSFMYVLMWAICAAAALGSLLLVNASVIGSYAAATESEVAWAGEPGWTAFYAVHRPKELIRIVVNTVAYQFDYYYQTLFGTLLGSTDEGVDVPYAIVMILSVLLAVISLRKSDEKNALSGRSKLIVAGVTVVLSGLLLGSMLIGWTPLSSLVILGVQGRYLLPVLPAVLLLVSNRYVNVSRDLSREAIYLMLCCNVFAFLRLYSQIMLHIPKL